MFKSLCWAVIAGASAITLAGCTSYEVSRASPPGAPTGDQGVVFVMSRPEFSLKKVEGSDPVKYQPQVTYVPDPSQRYVVRMKTSPLADPTFDLAFNDQGGLSSSTGDSQQQVGPTITAVAGLVTKVMAAGAAKSAMIAAKASAPNQTSCLEGDDAKGDGLMAACAIQKEAAAEGQKPSAAAPCPAISKDFGPHRRLSMFFKDDDDAADPLGTLVALDAEEANCLAEAGKSLGAAVTALTNAETVAVDAGMPTTSSGDAAKKLADKALTEGDSKAIRRLPYAAALAATAPAPVPNSGPPAELGPLNDLLETSPDKLDGQSIQNALALAGIKPDDFAPADTILRGLRVSKALTDAASLDPGVWRSRAVVNLQSKVLYEERAALQRNRAADAEADPKVLPYREQLAAMVNMGPEFARLAELRKVIAKVPDLDPAKRQSVMAEYAAYEKEAAAIQTELDTRLQTAQAKAAAAKANVDLPVASPWVGRACVDQSAHPSWRYTYGVDAPAFVILLKREDGAYLAPMASTVKGC